jgi:hypothetical protein
MTLPANVRVNTRVPFPAAVIGNGPVTIQKVNGVWHVGLQFQNLGQVSPPVPSFPTNFVIIYDAVANTYYRMSLDSLSLAASIIPTARLPVSGSPLAVTINDVEIGVDTSSVPTVVQLPSIASWSVQQANGLELCVFDYTGNAVTHNVTFTLNGTDVFVQGVSPVINQAFGLVKLRPVLTSPNKWFIRGTQ